MLLESLMWLTKVIRHLKYTEYFKSLEYFHTWNYLELFILNIPDSFVFDYQKLGEQTNNGGRGCAMKVKVVMDLFK